MTAIFGALTMVLLLAMVLARVVIMQRSGQKAMHFGRRDRGDFLIVPFALFYFYLVFANAFGWPTISSQVFFESPALGWMGVLCCLLGLGILFWSLVSFGQSFRVGIDEVTPDRLITTGVFAFSRNPIYVAFGLVLLGQLLIFPNWILLAYLAAALWLIHRQVLREEAFLKGHYGQEYLAYRGQVRRYL